MLNGPDGRLLPNEANIRWADVATSAEAVRGVDGLTYLEQARDGVVPLDAFVSALGISIAEVRRGAISLRCTVQPWQVNIASGAHGGFISALMDQATGLVILSVLDAGWLAPHLSSSYRFVRPAGLGEILVCRAEVVHAGRTVGTARCETHTEAGRLIATGDATNAVVRSFGPGATDRG